MKPMNGGSPAIDSGDDRRAAAVTGMAPASPPRRSASRVPVAWIDDAGDEEERRLVERMDEEERHRGRDGEPGRPRPRNIVSVPSAVTVV